jgi:uncharacterized protein (TIGR01777 family)
MSMSEGRLPDGAARTIAVSGSGGLIGSALIQSLEAAGHTVRRLGRGPAAGAGVAGADAVVNLAGENIAQRWSIRGKRRIRESRVETTRAIADAILAGTDPPSVFLSASAIGIYGSRGDQLLDEASPAGSDFLAGVVADWEAAASPAAARTRVVYSRTGIVVSPRGGALAKMLPAFRLGAGGRMGSGQQWMSWISLPDMVRALEFLLGNDAASGPFNVVAPHPVRNAEFADALGRALHRPALLPLPRFALELALGAMADGTILASQRVVPRRLAELGFEWRHPALEAALRAVLDQP